MSTKSKSKFTPAMEQRIRDSAPMNQARSIELSAEFNVEGVTPASVRSKAIRMGVSYERKAPATKTGAPVERKEAIVADLAALVGCSLEGLDKAPKPVLQALRAHLSN